MNHSQTDTDADSSNANLQKPSPKGIDLSGIPHFVPSLSNRTNTTKSLAPPLWNEKPEQFEYEFTIYVGQGPMFVTLWDTDDVSACQRASACNVTEDQITYSKTGNGFFMVRDEDWCFKKQPYQRSWQLHNKVEEPKPIRKSSPITADAILATL